MIQRIQSLFLLVAAVCFGVACFVPIGTINVGEMSFIYSPWMLLREPHSELVQETYYIGLLMAILAVISFVAIFFYKNRATQSKICMAAIFICFVLLLLMLYVFPDVVFAKIIANAKVEYYGDGQFPWVLLSFVSLACLYLADKFIKKDEKKVQAADRLR